MQAPVSAESVRFASRPIKAGSGSGNRAPGAVLSQSEACKRCVAHLQRNLVDLTKYCGSLEANAAILQQHLGGHNQEADGATCRHKELIGSCRRLIAAVDGEELAALRAQSAQVPSGERQEDTPPESALLLAALTSGTCAAGALSSGACNAAVAGTRVKPAAICGAPAPEGSKPHPARAPPAVPKLEPLGGAAPSHGSPKLRCSESGGLDDSCSRVLSLDGPVARMDERLRFHDVQAASTASVPSQHAGASSSTKPSTSLARVTQLPPAPFDSSACAATGTSVDGPLTREWQRATASVTNTGQHVPALSPAALPPPPQLPAKPTADVTGGGVRSHAATAAPQGQSAEDFTSKAISDVWAKYHPSRTGGVASVWAGAPSTELPSSASLASTVTALPITAGNAWSSTSTVDSLLTRPGYAGNACFVPGPLNLEVDSLRWQASPVPFTAPAVSPQVPSLLWSSASLMSAGPPSSSPGIPSWSDPARVGSSLRAPSLWSLPPKPII